MAEVLISIGTKILEYLVEPVLVRPLRPIFCFRSIVNDFRDTNRRLNGIREVVESKVEQARNNAQVIYNHVQEWVAAVDAVMRQGQDMENQLAEGNECCSNWTCHYRFSKQLSEITTVMKKLCEDGNFGSVARTAPLRQDIASSSSRDFMFSESAKIACHQIMEALMKDGVNMIGLYGMGGIGKTTLAKQVQNEVESAKMFDRVIMVTISQKPEVRNIQGTIADFLELRLEQETNEGRASKLKQRLKDEKILIILDDVWKKLELATIGIPLQGSKGCKVLLTTRRRDVCNSMDCQANVQLNLMSKDEALQFFKKKACLSNESKLNDVVEQIVEECNCLPIALATVGAALKNKGEDECREALENLRNARLVNILGIDNDEKNAYKCLRLSYDYLKDSTLQFMLLLCALFPEDYGIGIEDLTRCAFGMELFGHVDSIEDARRKVRVTIRCLRDSCLLLDTDYEYYVKIHDVVRDVVLWIGGTESRERNWFIVRDNKELKELVKKKSFQNCRALSIMPGCLHELFKHELVCPNLEAMLIFMRDGAEDVDIPDGFFKHMNVLKVLEMRNSVLGRKCRVPQSLQNLTELRTLVLRCCESSNSSILGELKNLEILALESSDIDCRVEVMSELKKIRLLDLSIWHGNRMLSNKFIETMLNLEELYGCYFLEVHSEHGSSLSVLKELHNLVVLSADIEDVSCIPSDFCFPYLERYDIRVGGVLRRGWWNSRIGLARRLHLRGIEEESTIRSAFNKLWTTVQELKLEGCIDLYSLTVLCSNPDSLVKNLKILKVEGCDKMEWVFEFQEGQSITNNDTVHQQQLSKLKILKLKMLPELKCVWNGPGRSISLCDLTEMEITRCSKLTCIFPNTQSSYHLPKLQELLLEDNDELEHVFEDQTQVECPSLEKLKVKGCPKVSNHFVASLLQAPSAKQLKEISLGHVQGLEEIMQLQGQDNSDDTLLTFGLEKLYLWDLKDLKCIWRRLSQNAKYTHLLVVEVTDCNKLEHLFTATIAESLCQLEELTVRSCNELEQVVEDAKAEHTARGIGFKNLRILNVSRCEKLKTIFPISIPTPQLEGLRLTSNAKLEHVFGQSDLYYTSQCPPMEFLCLAGCPKLCTQFIVDILQDPSAAKRLQYIYLSTIRGVEEIIQLQRQDDCDVELLSSHLKVLGLEDVAELKRIFNGPTQNISFSRLCEVTITGCNNLQQLFSTTIASSLEGLEKLAVGVCSNLEQVIEEDDAEDEQVLVFPVLKTLCLVDLPRLVSFCPTSCNLMLPSLKEKNLEVERCPDAITEFFSKLSYNQDGDDDGRQG